MNKYLLLYTISPIQTFIAQARKSRDLYGGSRILSDLMDAVIDHLRYTLTNDRLDVIFPNEEIITKSNRLLAKLEFGDSEKEQLLEVLNKTLDNKLLEIADEVFQTKKIKRSAAITNQLLDTVKAYWVLRPLLDNSSDCYKETYIELEKDLEAVKLNRSFEQVPEIGRKCSISGEQNALFFHAAARLPAHTYEDLKRKNKSRYPETYLTDVVEVNDPILLEKEGLSAIQFIKRFYKQEQNPFPSTAQIAALDVIAQIESEATFKEYVDIFKQNDFHYDEQLLFEENLTAKYFGKHNLGGLLSKKYQFTKALLDTKFLSPSLNQRLKKEIEEELEEGLIAIKKVHFKTIRQLLQSRESTFNRYYGLLVFDGDSMGKWMRADGILESGKKIDLEVYHKRISALLGKFSGLASDFVDSTHSGKTIYAGGDDFMAMLNLEQLTDSLIKLRKLFDEVVNIPLKNEFPISSFENLTFSAGLVIAPYKMPLHEVLVKAKKAEDAAKKIEEKNAFKIEILKGSGESLHAFGKWGTGNNPGLLSDFQTVWDGVKENFSTTFLRSLFEEFQMYLEKEKFEFGKVAEMIKYEAKRTIARACTMQIEERQREESSSSFQLRKNKFSKRIAFEVDELTNTTKKLFESAYYAVSEDRMLNFISLLAMIDFLKRKVNRPI